MLTRKTKYALLALSYLAHHRDEGPVLISALAEAERIPKKFLETILLELRKHGILQSRKGKGGGYMLNRDPKDIPLSDVVRMMDGPFAPVSCVSETAYAPCSDCRDEKSCEVRAVMKRVRDSIADIFENTSLADMTRRARR
jgi:Rrf2 family protein